MKSKAQFLAPILIYFLLIFLLQNLIVSTEPEQKMIVRSISGSPTTLRTKTPYHIKNVATSLIFTHPTQTPDLLTLSHWWELVPDEDHPTTPTYTLLNLDNRTWSELGHLVRKVQIVKISSQPHIFAILPLSCPHLTPFSETENDILTPTMTPSNSPIFIYYDDSMTDQEGEEIKCESYSNNSSLSPTHQYRFTSLWEELTSTKTQVVESIFRIQDIPGQPMTSIEGLLHPRVVRRSFIRNCGNGSVTQEFKYITSTTVVTRLTLENSFSTETSNATKTEVDGEASLILFQIVEIGANGEKAWNSEEGEIHSNQTEKSFLHSNTTKLESSEEIQVGPRSCVEVKAMVTQYDNLPRNVKLSLRLSLYVDGRFENLLAQEELAMRLLHLLKFSDKINYSYDKEGHFITYDKIGQIHVNSLIASRTELNQVVCHCEKKMGKINAF